MTRAEVGNCGHCRACLEHVRLSQMIVCVTCGNKRCPKATDHRLACTVSNKPGQLGSAYQ